MPTWLLRPRADEGVQAEWARAFLWQAPHVAASMLSHTMSLWPTGRREAVEKQKLKREVGQSPRRARGQSLSSLHCPGRPRGRDC